MTYEQIREVVHEMYYGRGIIKAPAELMSNAFKINMSELPFDEYYAAQVKCGKCGHRQLAIWPALHGPYEPSWCSNCHELEALPVCSLPPCSI